MSSSVAPLLDQEDERKVLMNCAINNNISKNCPKHNNNNNNNHGITWTTIFTIVTMALIAILAICTPHVTCEPSAYYPRYASATNPDIDELDTYYNQALENLLYKRTQQNVCIARGKSCDHRPDQCCQDSACRCNLWGTNCKCHRMGLFQKWGR